MSVRRLAWPLFGLWIALAIAASVLQLSVGGVIDALVSPALGVLAFVGALLSVRRPGNPIGPILLVLALLVTLSVIDEALYVPYDDDLDPPLAIRTFAALNDPLGDLWFVFIGILLPLLPDRPPAVAPLATGRVGRRRVHGAVGAGGGVRT